MKVMALFIALFLLLPISGYITARLACLGWKRGQRKKKGKEDA